MDNNYLLSDSISFKDNKNISHRSKNCLSKYSEILTNFLKFSSVTLNTNQVNPGLDGMRIDMYISQKILLISCKFFAINTFFSFILIHLSFHMTEATI